MEEQSLKEQRIRNLTYLYYSKPEILQAIFEFSKDREICPRYFEGFGKRPDSFQYKDDVFQLVKKGATSFHCSEELWNNVLEIQTGMTSQQLNELRKGWDFLIDIDSKYIDYSKIMLKQIIKFLNFHGVKNIGIKFSGSKGFHLIIPWKAFPKEINGISTKDKFPELPRIILQYISEKISDSVIKEITKLTFGAGAEYIRDYESSKEVLPDLILVSPRHLFRMPYSLHEKTSLSSIVLDKNKIDTFELKDADPMKITPENIKSFMPDSKEGEATELITHALDWEKQREIANPEKSKNSSGKFANYKPIELKEITEEQFPPCIKNILKGMADGKKRALFVLINSFRSIGMDKLELEKRIKEWNLKNNPQIKDGYIQSQLDWAYKRKPIMPSNCKEFYQGIACCAPDGFCTKVKNPVNYIVKKNFMENRKSPVKKPNSKPNPNL